MIGNGVYYHNGMCTLQVRSNKDADNGKSVTVSDGYVTHSAPITFGLASFEVFGNRKYTISLINSGSVEASTTLSVKYGETVDIDIHEPKTSKASLNKKVDGIKLYNDDEGNVHFVDGAGADSVINFKLKNATVLNNSNSDTFLNWTGNNAKQYKYILVRCQIIGERGHDPYCTMSGIKSFVTDLVRESGSNDKGPFESGTWVFFGEPISDTIKIVGSVQGGNSKERKSSCKIWGIK